MVSGAAIIDICLMSLQPRFLSGSISTHASAFFAAKFRALRVRIDECEQLRRAKPGVCGAVRKNSKNIPNNAHVSLDTGGGSVIILLEIYRYRHWHCACLNDEN